jgi:hypothetical protein
MPVTHHFVAMKTQNLIIKDKVWKTTTRINTETCENHYVERIADDIVRYGKYEKII